MHAMWYFKSYTNTKFKFMHYIFLTCSLYRVKLHQYGMIHETPCTYTCVFNIQTKRLFSRLVIFSKKSRDSLENEKTIVAAVSCFPRTEVTSHEQPRATDPPIYTGSRIRTCLYVVRRYRVDSIIDGVIALNRQGVGNKGRVRLPVDTTVFDFSRLKRQKRTGQRTYRALKTSTHHGF